MAARCSDQEREHHQVGGQTSTTLLDRSTNEHAPVEHVERARIGALDGLRAVAVLAVVAYHLWPDAVPAGFLGVDLFMVLSGFLITGLLMDGRGRRLSGLRSFWARRFRRLVPALLAVLTGVAVWVRVAGTNASAPTVRGQGLASLLYVGNWKLIHDGTSYAALAGSPSPLLHLWSLAIEEQFYLVWPLLLAAVMVFARRPVRATVVAASTLALSSIVLMAAWYEPGHDPLRLYFGTDTRAFAFCIGAIAFLLGRRISPPRVGMLAFMAVLLAFFRFDADDWLYQGGFAVFAVLAALTVVAATQPGPLARLLDRAPLRVVGRVSYGVYLWHWPVLVFVTEDSSPFRGVALLAVRLTLIAALTVLSWVCIEQPYRHASPRRAVQTAIVGVLITALCLVTLPRGSVLAYANADVSSVPTPVVAAPAIATHSSPVPRTVMIIGDSGMYDTAPALIAGFTNAGSTVIASSYAGVALTRPPGLRDSWAKTITERRPDLVVVMLGAWDYDFVAANGDAAYAEVVDDTVTMLTADGARVMWLSVLPGDAIVPGKRVGATALNRFYSTLPERYPGKVDYVDIAPALVPTGDELLRKPDQWHLCPDGAAAVAREVLAPFGVPDSTWRDGAWRADARYDDPPGGCPRR